LRKDYRYVKYTIAVHTYLNNIANPSRANLITHGLDGYEHPEILWKNVPLIFTTAAIHILNIITNEIIRKQIRVSTNRTFHLNKHSLLGFKSAIDGKGRLALEVVDKS
jgi:hypothetical protein